MGMINTQIYRYMVKRDRLPVVPGMPPPAYTDVPDFGEYMDKIEDLDVAWKDWTIPAMYLEKPDVDEEVPKRKLGDDGGPTPSEEGRPYSKRPEDKAAPSGIF